MMRSPLFLKISSGFPRAMTFHKLCFCHLFPPFIIRLLMIAVRHCKCFECRGDAKAAELCGKHFKTVACLHSPPRFSTVLHDATVTVFSLTVFNTVFSWDFRSDLFDVWGQRHDGQACSLQLFVQHTRLTGGNLLAGWLLSRIWSQQKLTLQRVRWVRQGCAARKSVSIHWILMNLALSSHMSDKYVLFSNSL